MWEQKSVSSLYVVLNIKLKYIKFKNYLITFMIKIKLNNF